MNPTGIIWRLGRSKRSRQPTMILIHHPKPLPLSTIPNPQSSSVKESNGACEGFENLECLPVSSHMMVSPQVERGRRSLYERFRSKRGILSVSDLISCAWCETQVEYGLLGLRHLKPSKRPTKIISSSGVEIKVNPEISVTRQKVLDGGKSVHAKLEKEVAPEKVSIKTITEVDVWGLKFLNSFTNLSILQQTGMMREIWVLGFVGDFLVQGIIDQMDLTSRADVELNGKPSTADNSSDYLVLISDSKTTLGKTLPLRSYTQSARYQLMLYKFLYDQLASRSFDLEKFGSHMFLDLDEKFSTAFYADIQPLIETKLIKTPKTLRELFEIFQSLVFKIGTSSSELEIVYRERKTAKRVIKASLNKDNKAKSQTKNSSNVDSRKIDDYFKTSKSVQKKMSLSDLRQEETNLQKAILQSLTEVKDESSKIISETKRRSSQDTDLTRVIHLNSTPPPPSFESHTSFQAGENLNPAIKSSNDANKFNNVLTSSPGRKIEKQIEYPEQDESLDVEDLMLNRGTYSILENSQISSMRSISDQVENGVVGKYKFDYHQLLLQYFVFKALELWNGNREPDGVSLEEIHKCK
ncbi:exonuclease V [Phakopsora pachyrhizi]|nr:exonuclease V [Phakopsora pachyrhizi]